ncbi:potassium channel family protein [Halegenticoccus soli]|uniref:potassium channel family protein n=1 Tax=Halegenticoccus soli TaxID=1985678 RepID=UPI0013043771|nr:NAD-binding protein [Halegenticoccus soli]
MSTLIIGGGHVGFALAERLGSRPGSVLLIDTDAGVVERARKRGIEARRVEFTDVNALRNAGVRRTDVAVVATDRDAVNLLVAQLLRTRFDVDRVLVCVNDPRNREPFEELGIDTVCRADTLSRALARRLSGPSLGARRTSHVEDADNAGGTDRTEDRRNGDGRSTREA